MKHQLIFFIVASKKKMNILWMKFYVFFCDNSFENLSQSRSWSYVSNICSSSHVVDTDPLPDGQLIKTCFFIDFLFMLLFIFMLCRSFLISCNFANSLDNFLWCWSLLHKSLPLPRLRSVFLWFLQGFRSNIKAFNSFWISLVQNKRYRSTCILLHGKVPVSQHHLFKGVFSKAPLTNFSPCCDKVFVQNNLRKNLFWITVGGYIHDDGNAMTTGWGSWSHCIPQSGVWQKWMLVLSTVSPFYSEPQPMGWCRPHSGWVFPPRFNLSGNILTDTFRVVFPWWL